MSRRRVKKVVKLARARVAGKVARGHSLRRRGMSIEARNEFLANQIAKTAFSKQTEALKVSKDGIVTNADYRNPKHRRWMED